MSFQFLGLERSCFYAEITQQSSHSPFVHRKHSEQLRRMGGINAARENAMAMSKQANILEDRLNKTRQKYNEAVKTNTDLKASIDESRRQRLIFESIYVKLEEELQAKTVCHHSPITLYEPLYLSLLLIPLIKLGH